MKYRNDFVTNSSSSSFIVSLDNDVNDVDKLFMFIKCAYAKWVIAKQDMIKYCKEHKEFKVEEIDGKIKITPIHNYKDSEGRKINWQLAQEVENKFGVSTYETYEQNLDWMTANTYAEYLEFTKEHKYIDAHFKPFEIIDLNVITEDDETVNEIMGWYYPCLDEYECNSACEYCNFRNTEKCVRKIAKDDFIKENGRLCVWSESGYIPDFVRYELEEICTLYCNHMG